MFVEVLSHVLFHELRTNPSYEDFWFKIWGGDSRSSHFGSCVWISLLGCVVVVAVLVPWCFVSLFL
jgi:hypothetical protein